MDRRRSVPRADCAADHEYGRAADGRRALPRLAVRGVAQPEVHARRAHGLVPPRGRARRSSATGSGRRVADSSSPGCAAAVATAIKPGVAFLFVIAVFVGLARSQRRSSVRRRGSWRLPLFVGLAASLTFLYVVIGRYATDFINPDATTESPDARPRADVGFLARLVGDGLVPPPLSRSPRTCSPCSRSASEPLGLALAPNGAPRAILWSLVVGYVAFGLAFASYTATHPVLCAATDPDPRPRDRHRRRAGCSRALAAVASRAGRRAPRCCRSHRRRSTESRTR